LRQEVNSKADKNGAAKKKKQKAVSIETTAFGPPLPLQLRSDRVSWGGEKEGSIKKPTV